MRTPEAFEAKKAKSKAARDEMEGKKKARREGKRGNDHDDGIKDTGSFEGKSNALGHGGRAAQMRSKGVPGGVIGAIARKEGAAPGGPNYHGKK